MNNRDNYFNRKGQESFVDIFKKSDIKNGQNFPRHWHEHLQVYYFISGTAKLECGKNNFEVQANDLVIVNPNELHYLESTSDNLVFYTIRFEPSFLFSNNVDLLQTKYLTPITLNRIEFNNLIQNNTELTELVKKVLMEYFNKKIGYELAIKGYIYYLVVTLLRNHVQHILTQSELDDKEATLIRFQPAFELIEKKYNEKITLNNGVKIPQLGLGTWFIDDDKAADAVKAAVELGYRHIDTAQAYGNERGVGEGIRTCGVPREELFVVSKVAAEHKTYEEAKAGIDETLKKMGLDYLDMMIIHSPQPWVEVNQSENRYVEGNRAAWRALEEAYSEGKLKAIGVSNFQIGDLESLMETAEIKPMVNQVLCHIRSRKIKKIDFCQKNDIAIEAYSPIAHGEILSQPEIKAIADKYGVSVPQFCIRYTLQLGAISLPKTANPEHMESNAKVDFTISAEDMEVLKNFKKIENYGAASSFPVYGGKM